MKEINSKIEFNLGRELFVKYNEQKCWKVIQNGAPILLCCLYSNHCTLGIHSFSISLL